MKKYLIVLFCILSGAALADDYAIVDENGNIISVIAWDGISPYMPPSGDTLIKSDGTASKGGTYSSGLFGGTFNPPVPPAPTAAQQSASAISAGVSVTSTATPTLNGVYGLDPSSQSNVNATVTYILLNGMFPGGGSTMPWVDQNGVAHTWPSITEFKAFATAYANYVAAISLYAASNGSSGSLPSNQVTIP